MIESKCPTCGSKVLLPDPPPNTQEQNIAFRKAWDARVEAPARDPGDTRPAAMFRRPGFDTETSPG